MKGTFFIKPFEIAIEILGEKWLQGSEIKGTLSVKSHDSSAELSKMGCHLCYCNNKKVKSKDIKAIEHIASIESSESGVTDFNFKLDPNCKISDKQHNYYILCGDLDNPFDGGMLEFPVLPTETITNFLEIFEQFYRFKVKTLKSKKGAIEAVITPPSSKDWTGIQKMTITLKMNKKELETIFNFKIKKISFDSAFNTTKDELLTITKVLSERDYSRYGSVNQDGISNAIKDVLAQVKLKPVI